MFGLFSFGSSKPPSTNMKNNELEEILKTLNTNEAKFVVKSVQISKLINYAESKIPKANANGNTKITPDEVRTFVDVVNVLVQKIKEIDQQFLQKGTNIVFNRLKNKAINNVVKNNSTTLMYMYNSSSVTNNFKNHVKPG